MNALVTLGLLYFVARSCQSSPASATSGGIVQSIAEFTDSAESYYDLIAAEINSYDFPQTLLG